MKLRIIFILFFVLFFVLFLYWQSFWLNLRFGCKLVDNGTYLVWMRCGDLNVINMGVVDYKFRNGKLIVKRYIVDDFDDERFYYCQGVEFYVYDRNNLKKYNKKEFSNIAKNYNVDNDFLSIDDRYLKYSNSNIDKEKCKMNNMKMR